jgi:hypothetical protein
LKQAGGLMLGADYPYTGTDNTGCKYDASRAKVRVTECIGHQIQREEDYKEALMQHGPMAIGN